MVTRDELWLLGAERLLREQRLSHGTSTLRGTEIAAIDAPDDRLLAESEREIEAVRALLPCPPNPGVAARVVVSARRAGGEIMTEPLIALSYRSLAMVSTPGTLTADCQRLLRIGATNGEIDGDYRAFPIVWRHGSGAVLLHEAAGHPAEHGHAPIDWPPWLAVHDEPPFPVDDTARRTAVADLLGGGRPSAMRRASFADVPLTRLSNVVARQSSAPFELPRRRIEVLLVDAGRYEPLTETISLYVSAADLVEGETSRRLRPFVIEESRQAVARALQGAGGAPERYPGVICSAEGQEVAVGSHAPLLLTRFR
ncbi:MAG TPA: hypothetical protein VNA04_01430 [Thermoanaerobaculia bacterium]|nr:hypothetical protein [Thermoanaerobaculia bacterium]